MLGTAGTTGFLRAGTASSPTLARQVQRINAAGHFSGGPRVETDQEELPGITANLGATVQTRPSGVLKPWLNLVDYHEDAVFLDMPDDIAAAYRSLEQGGKGGGLRPRRLSPLFRQPFLPIPALDPKTIYSQRKKRCSAPCCPDMIAAPPGWRGTRGQISRPAGVVAEHTADDIHRTWPKDHAAGQRTTAHAQGGDMRSTTVKRARAPGSRSARPGFNVVLCSPRLVKTGLNTIGWLASVLGRSTALYAAQAVRRGFRPTQTLPCGHLPCYADTMSERALAIAAEARGAGAALGRRISDGFASVGRACR
jgi:hypothetical protein